MCSPYVLQFIRDNINSAEVHGKRILEVGSQNVNGSARDILMPFGPATYLGIDLQAGSYVDFVCDAETLPGKLPAWSFDGLVSTEMLEHCGDWRLIIHNMKLMLKPGGWLVITTRSRGFPFHEYPIDHWRFEVHDMRAIFADCIIDVLEPDPFEPGVFIKATKPVAFKEADLSQYRVLKIIPGQPQ